VTDAQRYVHAMINSDHDTLVRIEQKHGLFGYPPEVVTIGLRAIADGKDGHAAIDAHIDGEQQ
jgi:hypothetical protein